MKRFVQLGPDTMMEDPRGDWCRVSEIEPLVQKAVDRAKESGLFAGSLIAEENAEELAKLRDDVSLKNSEIMQLHELANGWEMKCDELRDLMRWRNTETEPPDDSNTSVLAIETDGELLELPAGFVRANREFYPHWRPIGPLPTTEGVYKWE